MLVKRDEPLPPVIYTASRHSLAGAAVGVEVGLVGLAISTMWYGPAIGIILIALAAGLGLAGIVTLVALVVGRRDSSFHHLERDLEGAARLLERGLVDENDYQRLKSRALEVYRPGSRAMTMRDALRVSRWGALIGFNIPLLIHAFNYGWMLADALIALTVSAVGGGVLVGTASLFVQSVRRWRAHHPPRELPDGRLK